MSALKVKANLDGRICVLTVTGDLDCLSVTGFLTHAARVVDERIERFVLDLGGLTCLDAAGARALAMATHLPPSSCPVIIRSLSAQARRVLDLMDLMDLNLRQEPATAPEHHDTPVRQGTSDPVSQP
jgi:anti-anti-sigma factor